MSQADINAHKKAYPQDTVTETTISIPTAKLACLKRRIKTRISKKYWDKKDTNKVRHIAHCKGYSSEDIDDLFPLIEASASSTMSKLTDFFINEFHRHGVQGLPVKEWESEPENSSDAFYEKILSDYKNKPANYEDLLRKELYTKRKDKSILSATTRANNLPIKAKPAPRASTRSNSKARQPFLSVGHSLKHFNHKFLCDKQCHTLLSKPSSSSDDSSSSKGDCIFVDLGTCDKPPCHKTFAMKVPEAKFPRLKEEPISSNSSSLSSTSGSGSDRDWVP